MAIKRDVERWTLEAYITDALMAISENTAISALSFSGGKHGRCMTRRWADTDKPKPKEETRTPEEVTQYMLNLLRGGDS